MITEVKIEYGMGLCPEFIDGLGNKSEVSRVIMPLRIITEEEEGDNKKEGERDNRKKTTIVSGCSYWWECRNKDCCFSMATHEARKGSLAFRKRTKGRSVSF